MYQKTTQELLDFIAKCPSCYHTVQTVTGILKDAGYTELFEGSPWKLAAGGRYYVTRNLSSVIAFRVPAGEFQGFMLTASHSESPSFKIKPDPEMPAEGCYVKLNVEKYGGMILSTWLDRPLSVAGRVMVRTPEGVSARLVNVDRDLLVIPNLAIHMNRSANEGYAFNPQKDMLPLFGDETAAGGFWPLIAQEAGVGTEDLLGSDLFLYCRTPGAIWGHHNEFASSPRLDDLQCVFGTLKGFLSGGHSRTLPVYCVFDNEEVGSGTKQGAKSTFLYDVLRRINDGLDRNHSQYLQALASSFMLSADNGHAVHPNQPEKADPTHRPRLNGGVVIKYNANQKYTTDAVSEAVFRQICEQAQVPVQEYTNRSDVLGGSTLGNLSTEKVSINTADIGLAQLAMHSSYETVGSMDTQYLCQAAQAFYNTCLTAAADGVYRLENSTAL